MKLTLEQIEVPAWARKPKVTLEGLDPSEYLETQKHRKTILNTVFKEVTEYLSTDYLVGYGDEDMFPNLSKMSGEYYVENESYEKEIEEGKIFFYIGIMTHFLENRNRRGEEDDYLGLHVWIKGDPSDWTFSIFRNTDSSSI